VTRSTRIALDDLRLERVLVVHPGPQSFPPDERIDAVSIQGLEARIPSGMA
jgi:hypothetical protein